MRNSRHFLSAGILIVVLILVSACDSSEPGDEQFQEVAGTYTFTTFSFDPSAAALPSFSLLDTLLVDDTELRLFDGGDFVLTYRFQGGNTSVISGTYSVDEDRIRLRVNEGSQGSVEDLLLDDQITFDRTGPGVLRAELARTLNLGRFSSEFEGTESEGTLVLELRG